MDRFGIYLDRSDRAGESLARPPLIDPRRGWLFAQALDFPAGAGQLPAGVGRWRGIPMALAAEIA